MPRPVADNRSKVVHRDTPSASLAAGRRDADRYAVGLLAGVAVTVVVHPRIRPDFVIAVVVGVPSVIGLLMILLSGRRWVTALGAFILALAPGWFGALVAAAGGVRWLNAIGRRTRGPSRSCRTSDTGEDSVPFVPEFDDTDSQPAILPPDG